MSSVLMTVRHCPFPQGTAKLSPMKRRPFLGALAASALPLQKDGGWPAPQVSPARAPTKITLLGTGTPHPSVERQSSSYLVETGGDAILLDHGTGSHPRLLQSGHKAVDITHAGKVVWGEDLMELTFAGPVITASGY